MSNSYDECLPELFDAWWQESFPFAPANKQTRENFIAFGTHLLNDYRKSPEGGDGAAA
jgi:hypothetical protein